MDPKELEEKQDLVIENIDTLMTKLDICVDSGMLDSEAEVHNNIYDLRDNADEVETPDELAEIVNRCKTIEMNIDRWLAVKGESSMSLSWPDLGEESIE